MDHEWNEHRSFNDDSTAVLSGGGDPVDKQETGL